MAANRPDQLIRETLEQRGVAVPDDELEELAAAHPALLEWIAVVEELAAGEPAFRGAVPPALA